MSKSHRQVRGKKIRDFRHSNDLTQEQFGALLGYSRATIQKIESGEANISLDFLDKMVTTLNYEINDVLIIQEDSPTYESKASIQLRAIEYKIDHLTILVQKLLKD